jgi:hypothetical protein
MCVIRFAIQSEESPSAVAARKKKERVFGTLQGDEREREEDKKEKFESRFPAVKAVPWPSMSILITIIRRKQTQRIIRQSTNDPFFFFLFFNVLCFVSVCSRTNANEIRICLLYTNVRRWIKRRTFLFSISESKEKEEVEEVVFRRSTTLGRFIHFFNSLQMSRTRSAFRSQFASNSQSSASLHLLPTGH